ncbi:hypothetical protein EW026_g7799 [Hermanssonia centrifuga]|uniref:Cux N-terminal domain-containing protein n=1 Tax=Hermanssonia centrifuga TaxID=98765 RepID=A0A4S4K6L5_9APHY|nr:hypothetical protein EW026_g7799 [Hermanssonia centrifuga]
MSYTDISLSELQKTMDVQGMEVVENQKESVVGSQGSCRPDQRSNPTSSQIAPAVLQCKIEFKNVPDNEKVSAFKGLLKAYQTEINNLTKRSKSAEDAFLNVYKILAEAPDPYPLLKAAVDQTVKVAEEAKEFENELKRLREENDALRTERLNETLSL